MAETQKPANHVYFFDTTLRDGEQSPGCSMTTQEKLTMAHALEDLGVDIVEAGFAMASEGDFAAIATITQAIHKPRIASLARAKKEDIEMAARAAIRRPRPHSCLPGFERPASGVQAEDKPRRGA